MKTTVLMLMVFCFCPYFVYGEPDETARSEPVESQKFPANCSLSVPDTSGWEVSNKSRIEFRISDESVAFLGLTVEITEYRDSITGEVLRVVSRHIPLIYERRKINKRSFFEVATIVFTQREEQERLKNLDEENDPILYLHWHMKKNFQTGKDVLDGGLGVDIWLLKSSGECLVSKNEKVAIQFLTENVGNGKPNNVFVGVQYKVGDVYHILKVNRGDLIKLGKVEKERK